MKIEFNNKELEKIKPLVVWVTGCLARCDHTSDEKDGLGGLFCVVLSTKRSLFSVAQPTLFKKKDAWQLQFYVLQRVEFPTKGLYIHNVRVLIFIL